MNVYFFIYLKKNSTCLFLSLLKKYNKKIKIKIECLGFLAYLLFYYTFCMFISFFIEKKKKKVNVLGVFGSSISITHNSKIVGLIAKSLFGTTITLFP